ncbi:MAG: DNA mismatch repair protein MutS, partial [Bdellovibrionaceae bacterium]|nr:DNA mismatch repair protein MutS [Pseudobdellovibrionaceae bacterium]
LEQSWARPRFGKKIYLKASRHPVISQLLGSRFIPNDIVMAEGETLLLTGPNMAGKSTLMRQVALTAILAQCGSFVPASEAELPLFDSIFTRIGASDHLTEGLSTFMVEMNETAAILREAGSRSLVIMDEIGRGTATFDGMSLAQAILEFVVSEIRCYCLFATHYHELTEVSQKYPRIRNAHMAISDRGGKIDFLYTLLDGPARKSYGVQVAELAGIPEAVLHRARALLREREGSARGSQLGLMEWADSQQTEELSLETQKLQRLLNDIKSFSVSSSTPLEALNAIARWQFETRDY